MDMITLAMAKAYTDSKGGYTTTAKEYLLPQTNFVAEYDPELGGSDTSLDTNFALALFEFELASGKSPDIVVVSLDGKTYVCNINIVEENGTTVGIVIGNRKWLGLEDTGEPFVFVSATGHDSVFIETGGEHTFAIYCEKETIVPIDQKYLPEGYGGGGLTVVEINTPASADGTPMTAAESAKMDEALAKELPIIVKYTIDFGYMQIPITSVCICMRGAGFSFYYGGDAGISFQKIEDGNWVVVSFGG